MHAWVPASCRQTPKRPVAAQATQKLWICPAVIATGTTALLGSNAAIMRPSCSACIYDCGFGRAVFSFATTLPRIWTWFLENHESNGLQYSHMILSIIIMIYIMWKNHSHKCMNTDIYILCNMIHRYILYICTIFLCVMYVCARRIPFAFICAKKKCTYI